MPSTDNTTPNSDDTSDPSSEVMTPSSDVITPISDVITPISDDTRDPRLEVIPPSSDVMTPSSDVSTPNSDDTPDKPEVRTSACGVTYDSTESKAEVARILDIIDPKAEVATLASDVMTPMSEDTTDPRSDVTTPAFDVTCESTELKAEVGRTLEIIEHKAEVTTLMTELIPPKLEDVPPRAELGGESTQVRFDGTAVSVMMLESMLATPRVVVGLMIIEVLNAGVASIREAPFPVLVPVDADRSLTPADALTLTESNEETPMASRSSSLLSRARISGKIDARRQKVGINSIMLVKHFVRIH